MNPSSVAIADLAVVLKVTPEVAWAIANHAKRRYFPTRLKRRGTKKPREIREPRIHFKLQLRQLNKWIQQAAFSHPRSFGGVKGRSHLMHAAEHCGHKYLWTLDVRDCFPSVRPVVLKRQLRRRGFRSDVTELLTKLLTVDNQIPQGSPTSNAALDFVLFELDEQLLRFAQPRGLFTGRYADDIVTSGDSIEDGDLAVTCIKKALGELGLEISSKKEEQLGFKTRGQLQVVHGTVTNDPEGPRITPTMRADYVGVAEDYVAACRAVQPQSLNAVRRKRLTLLGKINYAKRLRASKARHLEVLLRKGDDVFRRRVAQLDLAASALSH
jgi:hypothetical protein